MKTFMYMDTKLWSVRFRRYDAGGVLNTCMVVCATTREKALEIYNTHALNHERLWYPARIGDVCALEIIMEDMGSK